MRGDGGEGAPGQRAKVAGSTIVLGSDSDIRQGSTPFFFRAVRSARFPIPTWTSTMAHVLPASFEHFEPASYQRFSHTEAPVPASTVGASSGRDDGVLARIEASRPEGYRQIQTGGTRDDKTRRDPAAAAPKAKKSGARSATPPQPSRSPYNLRSRQGPRSTKLDMNTNSKSDAMLGKLDDAEVVKRVS